MNFLQNPDLKWYQTISIINRSFVCGYCGDKVSSDKGYAIQNKYDNNYSGKEGGLYICSNCNGVTFFTPEYKQIPGELFGGSVYSVPEKLDALYNEARKCISQNCYTAVVLICRKILMNIAVEQGAKENNKFIEYVNFLANEGFIPPSGKDWVDHIRKKGNEANHEVKLMDEKDAKDLIIFVEMLLKFIYEFPNMISSNE